MLTVGDEELSFDNARSLVVKYSSVYSATVLQFDFAGKPTGEVKPSNEVTLADLGRMTFINADLTGQDASNLIATKVAWSSVPPSARLEDADPNEPDRLYAAMEIMWNAFTAQRGIKSAKASKLLYIKRPFAFPILDRDVRKTYKGRYDQSGSYWSSIRDDLIDGAAELERLRSSLTDDEDETIRRAAGLPALRLLDIIAWSLRRR